MAISLKKDRMVAIDIVKGRHAAECQCRICEIARETIEVSRWQEAPEQVEVFDASHFCEWFTSNITEEEMSKVDTSAFDSFNPEEGE